MIRINLLSPLDKENLKWEKINNLAFKSIIWVLLTVALSVGIFLCSIGYLKTEKDAAAAELANVRGLPATQEVNIIEGNLQQLKGKVETVYAIQTGHIKWTTLFENIANLTPAGVRLTDISVQEETAVAPVSEAATAKKAVKAEEAKLRIQISGNAKTRELLLALEGNLKGSDMFFDLQYDTENYVESANIDFRYTFYIYKQRLLK